MLIFEKDRANPNSALKVSSVPESKGEEEKRELGFSKYFCLSYSGPFTSPLEVTQVRLVQPLG